MNDVKDILGHGLWTLVMRHGLSVMGFTHSDVMHDVKDNNAPGLLVMGHGLWTRFWAMDSLSQVIHFYLVVL